MSIQVCELPCSEKDKGVYELYTSLITKTDDDCLTVRAEVTEAGDTSCNQLPCTDAMMSWQEIFKKLLFIDADGCLTLRVVTVTEA